MWTHTIRVASIVFLLTACSGEPIQSMDPDDAGTDDAVTDDSGADDSGADDTGADDAGTEDTDLDTGPNGDTGDSTSPPSPHCTDGVDCRCDILVDAYGADIVFCEDFENPVLREDQGWQTTGGGWLDQAYAGINLWCQGKSGVPQFGQPVANVVNNNGCIYL